MQLSTIRSELRSSIGNPSTTDVADSDLNVDINAAYRDVVNKFRFHKARKLCEFDTVSGTAEYGLPTDVESLFRVRDVTSGKKLIKMGDREYAERQPMLTSVTNGPPSRYVRHRDYISVLTDDGGPPDGVYTIELFYKAAVVDLSADTDSPIIPEAWHRGIRLLARWYYYDIRKGDIAKASTAFEAWRAWLADKPTEIDDETIDIDSGVSLPTLKQDTEIRRRSHVDEDTFEKTL